MRLPPKIGERVKAKHPYVYRPDGCEMATVVGIHLRDFGEPGTKLCYILAYDNGYSDSHPWEDFWTAFE